MTERDSFESTNIDSGMPHSARIWNYWLGGKDNYQSDRDMGDQIVAINPGILDIARAQRAFLVRVVTHLVAREGVRQFLDIGTGLPTAENVHEVAQRIEPAARIVYVDHDPLVLAHGRALLSSTPEGTTQYLDADVREPDQILREAARTLDLAEPVAVIMLGITAHITDDAEAYGLVRRLLDALPSGSFLALCDDTEVFNPDAMAEMVREWNQAGSNPRVNRTPEEIAEFFSGLELLEPGVVPCPRWRPEQKDPGVPLDVDDFGGVGRKP
jgi:O-methyltransferase involved in polyketide biosynthesis